MATKLDAKPVVRRDKINATLTHFLGLIRFSPTVFALPFAALASVWAFATPSPEAAERNIPLPLYFQTDGATIAIQLLGILICMVAARSAAMAFNRLVDAKFDAANPRTAGRHIPAGLLSRTQVWLFFTASCIVFVLGTLLFLPNRLPALLSIPVLAWLCGYSLAKRFTSAAHVWLGVALAMSPICTWIAIRGEFLQANLAELMPSVWLAIAIACWVSGFDIIYACQDADFDREAKLRSIPARLGVPGALRLAAALHLAMWLVLAAIPMMQPELNLGAIYYVGLIAVAVLLTRQHWIVNPKDLSRVNEAFFTLNAIISFGFTLIAAVDSCLR